MTKKERRINERFISIMANADSIAEESWNSEDSVILVENYDPVVYGCYGNVGEMRYVFGLTSHVYKKLKDIYRGEYSDWGKYYLVPVDVDKFFDGEYRYCHIKKSHIKEIWKKNYIVLKNGGVYSIRENHWYSLKDFYKLRDLYNKKLYNHDYNGYSVYDFGLDNKDYTKHNGAIIFDNEPEVEE